VRRAVAAIVTMTVAASPVLAAATAELARARAEYARSEYQRAIDALAPIVADPRALADLSDDEALEAHKLLGLSYFFVAQSAPAEDRPALLDKSGAQFAALLFVDPDYALDAALEGPDAVAYFDQVKRDNADKLERLREERRRDEERKRRPQVERVVLRVEHDPARWQNWIPGGVGQFKNGQPGKGGIILGIQAITLGVSAGIYLSHASRYGWPVGRLPDDPDTTAKIRREQYVQIACGATFLLVYGWAVWDAYKHERPELHEETKVQPIIYNDDDDATPPPAPPATSLVPVVVPFVTPDAYGAVLSWEL
jgi:hypothetical protein